MCLTNVYYGYISDLLYKCILYCNVVQIKCQQQSLRMNILIDYWSGLNKICRYASRSFCGSFNFHHSRTVPLFYLLNRGTLKMSRLNLAAIGGHPRVVGTSV
jgi:hypothetical protein